MSPSNQQNRPDADRAAVLIFAVRYALGRRTYAPKVVAGELVRQQDALDVRDIDILIHDIEFQGRFGYGDPCDRETWADVLDWLREMRPIKERLLAGIPA